MSVIFGSARSDEKGKLTGGKAGDSKQTTTPDYKGEVSMQTGYIHSKGWVICRPISDTLANELAGAMKTACNNPNLGYDQGNRLGVITYGINSKVKTECDCSSLVRACIKACGINIANFTTANAVSTIVGTGQFQKIAFTSLASVKTGDILCTKTKGHIVICVAGVSRNSYKFNGIDYSKVFDPVFYAKHNPDVVKVYGTDSSKLFEHFRVYGMNEISRAGKTIATFNVEVYKSHNPDLLKTFGNDLREYYKHYCQYGYKENRRVI